MGLTSHRVLTDIFDLENVVQQTCMMASKNILIDLLRDIFRNDREYRYKADVFGFPLTPSQLGLDPNAGKDDEVTTRIFIGSSYRYDIKFNPSIIVRNTGVSYKPISFNQNWLSTTIKKELVIDGYGNQSIINVADNQVLVGAWDQTFEIKVVAESENDREEISDIIMVSLIGTRRKELELMGIFVKNIRSGGEAEQPYANDYLYTVSINIDIRSEWKVLIPISNVVERIALFLTLSDPNNDIADALSANYLLTAADSI